MSTIGTQDLAPLPRRSTTHNEILRMTRNNPAVLALIIALISVLGAATLGASSAKVGSIGVVVLLTYGFGRQILVHSVNERRLKQFEYALLAGIAIRAFLVVVNHHALSKASGAANALDVTSFHSSATWLSMRPIGDLLSPEIIDKIPGVNILGYPALLSLPYRLIGPDLFIGQIANLFIGGLNLALIGLLAARLLKQAHAGLFVLWMAALLPVFFTGDALVAKDPLILLGVLTGMYSMLEVIEEGKRPWRGVVMLLFSAILLASLRPLVIGVLMVLGVAAVFARRRITTARAVLIGGSGAIVLLGGILLAPTTTKSFWERTASGKIVIDWTSGVESRWQETQSQTGLVTEFFGGYSDWAIPRRVATLPASLVVQYIMPFRFWDLPLEQPWLASSRFGTLFWYLWVGPLAIYGYLRIGKSKLLKDPLVRMWAMIALSVYVANAFITAGTVARYTLPVMPVIVIVAGAAWADVRTYVEARRGFVILYWTVIYGAMFSMVAYLMIGGFGRLW